METIKKLFYECLRKLCLFFKRKIAAEVTCTETVLSSSITDKGINYIVGNCTTKCPNITYVKSEEELLNLYKDGK